MIILDVWYNIQKQGDFELWLPTEHLGMLVEKLLPIIDLKPAYDFFERHGHTSRKYEKSVDKVPIDVEIYRCIEPWKSCVRFINRDENDKCTTLQIAEMLGLNLQSKKTN